MIYFKRKTGEPVLVSETGIELPNVVIVPYQIIVDLKIKILQFSWAFWINPQAYLNNMLPFEDISLNMRIFNFVFSETSSPNLQQALDIFDWSNGGEISTQGEQTALVFFAGQPDPTTPLDDSDLIGDHWDGMIYNP